MNNIKSFHDKGFFLIKKFYSFNEIKKIKKNIDIIKKSKPKKFTGIMKYYEKDIRNKKNMLVRAEYFYKKNFVLTKLIDSRKIKSTLKSLQEKNV